MISSVVKHTHTHLTQKNPNFFFPCASASFSHCGTMDVRTQRRHYYVANALCLIDDEQLANARGEKEGGRGEKKKKVLLLLLLLLLRQPKEAKMTPLPFNSFPPLFHPFFDTGCLKPWPLPRKDN